MANRIVAFPCCLLLFIAASDVVILVQTQTASALTTFNATFACTMVKNDTFLKDPRACNAWIHCVDDEPILGTCENDLFFNRNTNECVDQYSIKCYSSEPCATITTNGFVADPYSCNGYFYCYDGKGTRGECSTGLNYNPGTGDCVRNFNCTQYIDPESWCNIIPDGVFFADEQSCQGYHMCNSLTLETGSCPTGYLYNAFDSVCDYTKNVKCNVPVEHPILSGEGTCQTAGQFVSDNATCSGYYYCKATDSGDIELIWGQCSNGRFFDPTDGGECVDRLQIVCDYNRCDGMGATNIQLANAPNDGCKGYLICQDEEEIGSGMCPGEEMYYDEVTQRCTASVVSYPACLVDVHSTSTTVSTTESTTINGDNLDDTTTTTTVKSITEATTSTTTGDNLDDTTTTIGSTEKSITEATTSTTINGDNLDDTTTTIGNTEKSTTEATTSTTINGDNLDDTTTTIGNTEKSTTEATTSTTITGDNLDAATTTTLQKSDKVPTPASTR